MACTRFQYRRAEALRHTPSHNMVWKDVDGKSVGVLKLTNQKNLDYALQEYGPYVDVLDLRNSKFSMKDISRIGEFPEGIRVIGLQDCVELR